MTRSKRNKDRLSGAECNGKSLATKAAAGILALSTLVGGCSTEAKTCAPGETTQSVGAATDIASQSPDVAPVDGEVVRTAEIESMGERMKESAIVAATRIVDILESESSGATPIPIWIGNGFSNRESVLGPDGEFETSDDNHVPETSAVYDPETGKVTYASIGERRGKNGKEMFTSAWITFKLGKRLDVNRALTLKDFREILNHQDGLSVEWIDTRNDAPHGVASFLIIHFDKQLNISTPQSERYKASTSSIDPGAQDALNKALFTLEVASEELWRRVGVR